MTNEQINESIQKEIKRRYDPLFVPDAFWYEGDSLNDRDAEEEIVATVERFGEVYGNEVMS